MGPNEQSRKRKAVRHDTLDRLGSNSSEDEFELGLLDGILSQNEEEPGSSLNGKENESDLEEEEDLEDESDVDEYDEDELGSDEIPSEEDEDDVRQQIQDLKVDKHGSGLSGDGTVSKSKDTTAVKNGAVHTNGDGAELSDEESRPNYTVTEDANGNPRYVYKDIDPVYDSDDSEAPATANTIGNIPLSFYDSYPHIGYNINGKKIMRPAKGEALDALLDSIDVPKGWTGLTDPATGKALEISQEELVMLKKLALNEVPEDGFDPYPVGHQSWFRTCLEI